MSPAVKSAVKVLPTVNITKELLRCDFSECVVCKDKFSLVEEGEADAV